jgi:hypothetical protein
MMKECAVYFPSGINVIALKLGVMVHAYNPSTWETEARAYNLSLSPAWATISLLLYYYYIIFEALSQIKVLNYYNYRPQKSD